MSGYSEYKVEMLPDSPKSPRVFTWYPDEVYQSNKSSGYRGSTAKYSAFPDLPSPSSPPMSPVGKVVRRKKKKRN